MTRFPSTAGWAANRLGWQWGMWLPGALGLAIALFCLATVRDSPEEAGYHGPAGREGPGTGSGAAATGGAGQQGAGGSGHAASGAAGGGSGAAGGSTAIQAALLEVGIVVMSTAAGRKLCNGNSDRPQPVNFVPATHPLWLPSPPSTGRLPAGLPSCPACTINRPPIPSVCPPCPPCHVPLPLPRRQDVTPVGGCLPRAGRPHHGPPSPPLPSPPLPSPSPRIHRQCATREYGCWPLRTSSSTSCVKGPPRGL